MLIDYYDAVREAKKRFPNSPSRQQDFITGWKNQPRTGSYCYFGNSCTEKNKLRIR